MWGTVTKKMVMYRYLRTMVLCFIIGHTSVRTATSQKTTTTNLPPTYRQGPKYTINCLENGDVSIRGITDNSKIPVIYNRNNSRCLVNPPISNSGFTIPHYCTLPDDIKQERTVIFNIHDPTFDGGSLGQQRTTVAGLNGGLQIHTVTVKCTPLMDTGVKLQVVHALDIDTATIIEPDEVGEVAMYVKTDLFFTKQDVTNFPDISSVYIGDKFYLYLVYLGSEEYKVIPTKCSAFDGYHGMEPAATTLHVDLWTNTGCLSSYAKDYRIMRQFHPGVIPNVIYAEMYGFRFNNNNQLTFVCDVNVCKDNGNQSCQLPKTCDNDWSPRSKRTTHNSIAQKRIFRTIRVYSNQAGYNGCSGPLMITFFLISTIIKQL